MTIAPPGTPVAVAIVGAVGVVVVAIVGPVAAAVAVLVLTAAVVAAVVAMLVLEAVLELGPVATAGDVAAAGAGRLSATVVAATRPAARQHRDMIGPPVLVCALMGAPSSRRRGRS